MTARAWGAPGEVPTELGASGLAAPRSVEVQEKLWQFQHRFPEQLWARETSV